MIGCVEPRLCRPSGAARKSQSSVSIGGDDGARQTDNYACETGQQWVPGERCSCTEVLRIVQTVWRTTVETGRHRCISVLSSSPPHCIV